MTEPRIVTPKEVRTWLAGAVLGDQEDVRDLAYTVEQQGQQIEALSKELFAVHDEHDQQVKAVLTLHRRAPDGGCSRCASWVEDSTPIAYPCPTVRALGVES